MGHGGETGDGGKWKVGRESERALQYKVQCEHGWKGEKWWEGTMDGLKGDKIVKTGQNTADRIGGEYKIASLFGLGNCYVAMLL